MSKKIVISVNGVKETIAELKLFDLERTVQVKSAVNKNANKVARIGKKNFKKGWHDRTGYTRQSIKKKILHDGLVATVKPRGKKGKKPAGLWLNSGTKERTQKKTNKSVGRINGNNFMDSAEKECEPAFIAEIRGIMEKDATI